MEEDEAKYNA
jgi:hypothetical protein